MKLVFSLFIFFSSSIVLANPVVGDYANFNMTLNQGGAVINGSYEIAIVAKTETGFKVSTTINIPDQPSQYEEQDVPTNQILGDAQIGSILGQCSMYGGAIESITIPAGTYSACNLPTDSGRAWVTQVPFGVVKQIQKTESSEITLELKSFIIGQ